MLVCQGSMQGTLVTHQKLVRSVSRKNFWCILRQNVAKLSVCYKTKWWAYFEVICNDSIHSTFTPFSSADLVYAFYFTLYSFLSCRNVTWPFIKCMYGWGEELDMMTAEACGKWSKYDWDKISTCTDGDLGQK